MPVCSLIPVQHCFNFRVRNVYYKFSHSVRSDVVSVIKERNPVFKQHEIVRDIQVNIQ